MNFIIGQISCWFRRQRAGWILPQFPLSRSGVRSESNGSWRATTDDPWMRFPLRYYWRPLYVAFFLEATSKLNPKVYFDRGCGFHEGDCIELRHDASNVYILNLPPAGNVKALRLDPSDGPATFRFWGLAAWDQEALKLRVQAYLNAIETSQPVILNSTTIASRAPRRKTKRRFGFRRRSHPVSFHYAQMLQLASGVAARTSVDDLSGTPIFSFVVPVFNTPVLYLEDLVGSFQSQVVGLAELILSDDGSTDRSTTAWLDKQMASPAITIVRGRSNLGIAAATNAGIARARGDWVCLLDHDDALTPHAVAVLHDAIKDRPQLKFVYTDEVVTNEHLQPIDFFLKPAYDTVLLSGVNYINHLSCYRRDRLLQVGGIRQGYDGSQDYDLLLRYLAGLAPKEIGHLPYPAYLWRRHKESFSKHFLDTATRHARRALAEGYRDASGPAKVAPALDFNLHRVQFDVSSQGWPLVSIVIPNRNALNFMKNLLDQLGAATSYPRKEIIIVDNGTTDPEVLALYESARLQWGSDLLLDIRYEKFNFAAQVNRGIALSRGDYVLLLNNDISILDPSWLEEMVSCFQYERTGIVGAKLLYKNRTIQHAGVIVGLGGVAGHWYVGEAERFPGPMGRLTVRQSMTAVTGACMLVSRECLNVVGILDEANFPIAYNDVDYCLRAVMAGFRVVWTPFASLIHYESASRGSDMTKTNFPRFQAEQGRLKKKYLTSQFLDRAFNPWWTLDQARPGLRTLDQLPTIRH